MNNLSKAVTKFITMKREMHIPDFADTAALVRQRKKIKPKRTLKCKRTTNFEKCSRKVSGQKGAQISKG